MTKPTSTLKKITYVITRSDIGGAQFHTLALLEEFRNTYDILLVSGSHGVLIERAEALGIRTKVIADLDSFNFIGAVLKLRKILQVEQPDLVHVHSSLASFYGRCAAKLGGLSTLYTVHGWHFSHEPNRVKRIIKIGIERCLKFTTDYWLTVSDFDKRLGTKHKLFRSTQVETINNGVPDAARKRQARDNKTLDVVFLGRATYQKNCESALRTLELTDPNIRLTMYASGGSVDTLQSHLKQCTAKDRVNVVWDNPNAADSLADYSVMLLTSRYEGMPLGALEAMSASLAVISTNVCGMNEVVQNNVNGYLLPENDERAIADCLNRLLNDPERLNKMGRESHKLYQAHFTQEKMLSAIGSVYRKLC